MNLKPCPFCGGAPCSTFIGDDDGGYWAVECHNKNCAPVFAGAHADSEEAAKAAWNRRRD